MKNDDAIEGVILQRRGGRPRPLKRVEAKTEELNREVLPKDVKIRPFYDRSSLVALTTTTVETNLVRGMILVLVVLLLFLFSLRAAIITALTIPLALLFAFTFLHLHDVSANLLSIGAIDFGILIDGAIVMMENIYRELAARHGQKYDMKHVILTAAKDVDRPFVFGGRHRRWISSIYALTGASASSSVRGGHLAFGLLGAFLLARPWCRSRFYWFKHGVKSRIGCSSGSSAWAAAWLVPAKSDQNDGRRGHHFGVPFWCPLDRRRVHAASGRRRCGPGDAVHHFL
jgi:cobalt-zinc-cadmium resistance protein CzcA